MSEARDEINQILQGLNTQAAHKSAQVATVKPGQPPRPAEVEAAVKSLAWERKPRKAQPIPPQQRYYLWAGAGFIALGLGLLLYSVVTGKVFAAALVEASPPVAAPNPLIGTPEGNALQARSKLLESKIPTVETAAKLPQPKKLDCEKERERIVKWLTINGKAPDFVLVADLEHRLGKTPLKVHCLLREPLDNSTAAEWAKAGLLIPEDYRFSPCLCDVLVSKREQLAVLNNWRIAGVEVYADAPVSPVAPKPKPVK